MLTERPGADFCLLIADESKSLIWRTNPMHRMSKKTSFAKFDWKQPPAVRAKVSPPRTAEKEKRTVFNKEPYPLTLNQFY